MAGLNDFQTGPDVSLADFQQDAPKAVPVNNPPSTTNLAAHAVMFSDDPKGIQDNYNAIHAEMSEGGKSALADNLVGQIKSQSFDKARQSLVSILADPNIPDDQKQKAASAVYDTTSSLYSVQNIVSTESAAQPVENEPHEAQVGRVDIAAQIDYMNKLKAEQQRMLNREAVKNDPSTWDHINDVTQMMAPGADEYLTGSIKSALDGGSVKDRVMAFLTLGSSKDAMHKMLLNTKPEDRLALTQKVIDIVNDHSNIAMSDTNDFARVDYLRDVIQDGYYDDEKKWVDNVTGVLDATVLGGAIARGIGFIKGVGSAGRAARAAAAEEDAANKMASSYVRSKVQPTTVSQNVKDVNPDQARAIHEVVASDDSGEAAQAMYGASKDEAVANDLTPEVATPDGSVKNKVASPDAINNQAVTPDPEVSDFVNTNGAIYYTRAEKASARANVVNDFQHAFDLTDRKEMFQVLSFDKADKSNGVQIKAVYGPQNGGYSNPLDAIELAKWALRKHGIDDSNITLLKRQGSEYVPVDPAELKAKQDPGFYNGSNPDEAFKKGHYAEANVKGSKVKLVGVDHGGDVKEVVAYDENGKQIGNVLYGTSDIRTDNPNVKVDPNHQRKGIANAMYDYAEKHGAKFPSADAQKNYRSEAGQSFRDARGARKDRLEFTGPSGGGSGDYLIQVHHNYDFNPGDVGQWSEMSVKNNPFDRLAPATQGRGGSLNRHFVDIASMLDPTITHGASVQIDKAAGLEKRLLDLGSKFGKAFKDSSPEMQQKMVAAITEANSKGLDMEYMRLAADGFTPNEIDTLKNWRDYWDTQWYLENRDMAKTLSTKGYMQYIDPTTDTNLFARPVQRAKLKGSVKVYNTSTGDIDFVKSDELDALYANGGKVAQLRQPIMVGDDAAELIVSPEKAGGGYLRAIKPDTSVLAYRKGYYHVQYKDPHFIIKNVKTDKGHLLYQKAVATAGSVKDADLMIKRLQATDGGEYFRRSDKNSANYAKSDADWDLHVTHGRSTQRIRGQRLEDATSTAVDPGMGHIASPLEAMINSARSISRRASTRDYLEATKARFISQYGEFLPEGKFGQKMIPGNRKEVGFRGDRKEDAKKLAAARSTYEFIRYMENGYINSIDDSVKAMMNTMANIMGEHGLNGAEKAAHWLAQGKGPTGIAKTTAFTLYLALNPLRQFLVQAHQCTQLLALNPLWIASGMSARQTAFILAKQAGLKTSELMAKGVGMSIKELDDMYKAYQKSGLSAAIDKQNLVRENMLDIADQFNKPSFNALKPVRKVLSVPGKVARGAKKIGFDAGENFNMVTAWLAHRDLAAKAGKDLTDPEVLDQIAGATRNFTYNMNSAGDMPYNQNALGGLLQFMQQGHKAILTMTLNRGLTPAMKARLIAFNALMYGLPSGFAIGAFANYLPKNQDAKDVATNGLEGTVFNKLLSMATGEKTRIDFSGVSPVNMYGFYDFIHNIFTTDVGTIVAGTPSGQLFFGGNSRLTKFVRTAAQYFNLVDNYGDPVKFSQVATDFAKLSSGMSNAFKAAYALKYHQKVSSAGNVNDTSISSAEAVAQLFGFQTLDESTKFLMQDYMYQKSKAHDDDVKTWYKNYKSDITRDGMKPEELDYVQKTYTEAFRVWGNDDYRAKQLIDRMLATDIENGDDRMYKQVMNSGDFLSPDEFRQVVSNSPDMSDDEKQKLNDLQDQIDKVKEEN